MKDSKYYLCVSLLSLVFLFILLGIWHAGTLDRSTAAMVVTLTPEQEQVLTELGLAAEDRDHYLEYGLSFEQLRQVAELQLTREEIEMSGGIEAFGLAAAADEDSGPQSHFPTPRQVFGTGWEMISDPFYDKGPNDKGIGLQLAYSLRRVALGFGLALLVAIPLGFLMGMSPLVGAALMPYVQILKPISPLAWMPLALYTIKDAEQSSIFVIFICSIWPMLINTMFGVAAVRPDWLQIGRTLELSRWAMAWKVILPSAAPTIFTGMRISVGISWLVIVAAEMLIGGTGMGYFVWNEWNGLNIDSMIVAIFVIGAVGLVLDLLISLGLKAVQYQE